MTALDDSRVAPFAAFIAHELRNPLATQRALLELALADPNADITACARSDTTCSRPASNKNEY